MSVGGRRSIIRDEPERVRLPRRRLDTEYTPQHDDAPRPPAPRATSASPRSLVAHFVFERSTKNKHRYQEVDSRGHPMASRNAIVGLVYVRHTDVADPPPARLRVTIDFPR